MTELAAMPGLNNDIGAIQAVADIAAIRDPIFPPYSGGNEVTAMTIFNGKQLAQVINCTSGVLARLDPRALRDLWLTLASAPWLDAQKGATPCFRFLARDGFILCILFAIW